MRARLQISVALAVAGAFLVAAAPASATVSCVYQERGAVGDAGNRLLITTTGFADGVALSRSGTEIVVVDDVTITPVACTGPQTPTVSNLDKVRVEAAAETSFYMDLATGPFAPGVTDEGGTDSEIEFTFDWLGGFPGIGGTDGVDTFEFGEALVGPVANLNGPSELTQDTDLKLDDLGGLLVRGFGGGDVITGKGLATYEGWFRGAPMTALGGRGRDFVLGGWRSDLLAGQGGQDTLRGGRGRDALHGGRGRDDLEAQDGSRDQVACGPGIDHAEGDASDHFRGCEHVSVP